MLDTKKSIVIYLLKRKKVSTHDKVTFLYGIKFMRDFPPVNTRRFENDGIGYKETY